MSDFYQMYSVINRPDTKSFQAFYESHNILVSNLSLGYGTALPSVREYFGLANHEKIIITSIVTRDTWGKVKKDLLDEMKLSEPGNGIAFIVPLSGVGGRSQLMFLTNGQVRNFTEEATLKNTKYELLTVISDVGHNAEVMDAARKAGARGGTVLHARGTGENGASQFFGLTLATEKEITYIVVKSEDKTKIMETIMAECGIGKPANAIVYSMPVSSTCGISFEKPSELIPDSEKIDD